MVPEQTHTTSDDAAAPSSAGMPDGDPFKPLRRGLLELALLTTLRAGRLYAAELVELLADTPFATQEGTLYPLLGKLRRDGFLEHEWVESDAGPPRKYHRLTEAGTRRLEELRTYWSHLATALERLGDPR